MLQKLSEDFQENILGGECFRKCMAVDNCFWTVQMEDFQEKIIGGVILVYNRYSEQLVCNLTKRMTLPLVFPGEIFENGWLWTAASEQSKTAACNVIRFLTIKISFGILL